MCLQLRGLRSVARPAGSRAGPAQCGRPRLAGQPALSAGARQRWQIASASASAASAGRGGSVIRSSRITMAVTWSLSARPLPVTAALTSLGVCSVTGSPRRAAQTIATAPACAVPITVRTLCWLNTRSTATVSGRYSVSQRSISSSIASSRAAMCSSASVRTTPTATRVGGRPGTPSTTPSPHLVRPGSMPKTRDGGRGAYWVTTSTRSSRAPVRQRTSVR